MLFRSFSPDPDNRRYDHSGQVMGMLAQRALLSPYTGETSIYYNHLHNDLICETGVQDSSTHGLHGLSLYGKKTERAVNAKLCALRGQLAGALENNIEFARHREHLLATYENIQRFADLAALPSDELSQLKEALIANTDDLTRPFLQIDQRNS